MCDWETSRVHNRDVDDGDDDTNNADDSFGY